MRRDVLPRFIDLLTATSYSQIKGPIMWLQAARAGGRRPIVQLVGHHYLAKTLYPYGRGYFDAPLIKLGYQLRSAEQGDVAEARYEATLLSWKECHGFDRPWSEHLFFWVLQQWLKNPVLYHWAFPALPQRRFCPDPGLLLLEEGDVFSVVPELKPYLTEKHWWELSDDLTRQYEVAIAQWRRDLGVIKTWSPDFTTLRKAYFMQATRERQYHKVKEDEAVVQFVIRETERYGYELIAEGFGLAKRTVEGHVKDVAKLLEVDIGPIPGGRRRGKPGGHAKAASAHIETLKTCYEQRIAQAKKLSEQWVLSLELRYEVTLDPDPDTLRIERPRHHSYREPLYPRLRLLGHK